MGVPALWRGYCWRGQRLLARCSFGRKVQSPGGHYFTPPVGSIVGAWSRKGVAFKGGGQRESACGLVQVGGEGWGATHNDSRAESQYSCPATSCGDIGRMGEPLFSSCSLLEAKR